MSEKLKEHKHGKSYKHKAPIYDANGNTPETAGKVDDFTEMFAIQEKLETALFDSEKASLAKDIFLANINHELRTPINCILGFSELALEGDISPQTKEYLDRIIENTERLLRIIENFFYISKTVTFNTMDMADQTPGKISADEVLKRPAFRGDVLVCEDNRINQRIIAEHLARVGLNAEIAGNGREGIEKVKERIEKGENPFDLIFMDIHMPVMDGIEAGQKIIELGSGAPVVAMTSGTGRDREFYKTIGMNDCISKPFTPQELWRCLTKYLNSVNFDNYEGEKVGEKPQKRLTEEYGKSDQGRLGEIASAVEAGDIRRARMLAHTSEDDADGIDKTALENQPTSMEECASMNFYRTVFRIILAYPNMEQAIMDDLFTKAAAH